MDVSIEGMLNADVSARAAPSSTIHVVIGSIVREMSVVSEGRASGLSEGRVSEVSTGALEVSIDSLGMTVSLDIVDSTAGVELIGLLDESGGSIVEVLVDDI